jgi:hypothetical protein
MAALAPNTTASRVAFGDFIAHIASAYSPRNGRQGAAFATADLAAQQATNHGTYANADGAVFRSWHGLRVGGLRLGCLHRLGLRVVHRSFVLHSLLKHWRRQHGLRRRRGHGCGIGLFAFGMGDKPRNGRSPQQADHNDGHGSTCHQRVDAV